MAELPRVASNFYTTCPKCESERYHKVLAHTGNSTAKLECEVCHAKKNYTITKGKTVAKKTRTKKSKSADTMLSEAAEKYRGLLDKVGEGKVEPYRMTNTYSVDVKIEHPKFPPK